MQNVTKRRSFRRGGWEARTASCRGPPQTTTVTCLKGEWSVSGPALGTGRSSQFLGGLRQDPGRSVWVRAATGFLTEAGEFFTEYKVRSRMQHSDRCRHSKLCLLAHKEAC